MKPCPPFAIALGFALAATLALCGCASPQPAVVPTPSSHESPLQNEATASARPNGAAGKAAKLPNEVRTRNAMFKLASYDDLPGWQQDDMRASWSAFRNSCEVLQKRDDWREICTSAKSVPPSTRAMRSFFESRFTLLRILNTDATREGDVTGYFEPLLEGQPLRDAEFNVPVMGVPRDLFTIDWSRVPKAQRQSVVSVRPEGNLLLLAQPGEAHSYALDLRRFELDDRDRRLRVRLVGEAGSANAHAEPYYTRAELDARGLPQGIAAPVIVWVNDPLALYAMQVQGSGRVRLPDGSILRLQYAEQNGHPFKPLRVVPKSGTRIATRGGGNGPEQAEQFVIEGDAGDITERSDDAPLVTRGGRVLPAAPRDDPAPTAAPAKASGDPLVDELLKNAGPPRKPAPKRPVATTPVTASKAGIAGKLLSDPSYVFFKTASDRPQAEGPQGALGVPLTPGRSVAVDPRVTPLGYPVFLSAPAAAGSPVSMQRLVFAQDTGGAIRGAVRADYFWGFGNDAGQMARATRLRGQMWVLLPTAEAARLSSSRLVTRGRSLPGDAADSSCLVPDGEFCAEAD